MTDPLAPIRARAVAATPGPWVTSVHAMPGATVDEWFVREIVRPNGSFHPWNILKVRGASNAARECCWPPTEADAAFIAHAREDVPALLATLDAADAVMFSEEAIERAAEALGNRYEPWTESSVSWRDVCRDDVRAVVAALRGEA